MNSSLNRTRMSETMWKIFSSFRAIIWKTAHLWDEMTPNSVEIVFRWSWSMAFAEVMVIAAVGVTMNYCAFDC